MDRNEFMRQLKNKLRKLPFDEVREAVEYYEQYFDDAGAENERAVIAELGSPSNVASQIMADFAIKDAGMKTSARRGLSGVWIVILAVFASPIALPLALAVVACAIAILVSILAVFISIAASGVAVIVSGLACVAVSVPVLFQSFATSVFYLGVGLFAVGAGMAILIPTAALTKKSFGWLAKRIGGFILRRSGR